MTELTRECLPRLPDIGEVVRLGPGDQACLVEIRQVLERHGALQRFGVTLLHQHFDVGSDEVLVETIDAENRILSVSPRKIDSVGQSIETSWRLDSPTGQQRCETRCETDRNAEGEEYHRTAHYTTS